MTQTAPATPSIDNSTEHRDDFDSCFAEYRQELCDYLVLRFGSRRFARRVMAEVYRNMKETPVLALVGEPRCYLMGYGLALGLHLRAHTPHT